MPSLADFTINTPGFKVFGTHRMLCALSLKPDIASPFEIVGPQYSMTLIERTQALIPKTGAHWEQVFQSLSLNEQAALGPFLLDVATIQNSRKGEAGQLEKLLRTGIQNGMTNS